MISRKLTENDFDDEGVDIQNYISTSADPNAAFKELGFQFAGVNTAHPNDPCNIWRKRLNDNVWITVVSCKSEFPKVRYFKDQVEGPEWDVMGKRLDNKMGVPIRDIRRILMNWKHEDAKAVVHHLLDSPLDALDPRADLENLIQHKCPQCGSSNVIVEDEGTVDCCNCGHWFMEDNEPEFNLADEISDLRAYALANGDPPRIRITFSRTTPESVERGDYSETGWEDEQGVAMIPDEWDREEGLTATDKAAEFLYDKGAYEDSSSTFHPGIWYSSGWSTVSYRTGEEEELSYHLTGFTPEQEKEVYDKLHALRKR